MAVHWVALVAWGLISVAKANTGPIDFNKVLKNVITQPDPEPTSRIIVGLVSLNSSKLSSRASNNKNVSSKNKMKIKN